MIYINKEKTNCCASKQVLKEAAASLQNISISSSKGYVVRRTYHRPEQEVIVITIPYSRLQVLAREHLNNICETFAEEAPETYLNEASLE